MILGKFKSLQPLFLYVGKRETDSKKEQERALKLVLVLLFRALRLSSLLVGTSVIMQAPSSKFRSVASTPTTLPTKKIQEFNTKKNLFLST
jgi:hypothetical protein